MPKTRWPQPPPGYRWVVNEQDRFIDVQLFKGGKKKRKAIDAFCVLRLDRSAASMEEIVIFRMKQVLHGLAR